MQAGLKEFIQEVEAARKRLNKEKPKKQLHSQRRRDELRTLAEKYFNLERPTLSVLGDQDPDVAEVDAAMQQIIKLCHKHGSVLKYQDLLSTSRKHLIAIESRHVLGDLHHVVIFTETDMAILDTLKKLLPTAQHSYEQALLDLASVDRLSWRGPATDLREALREVLDHLAPDQDVTAAEGYKSEADARGPTMKQKVRYILRNRGIGKAAATPAETATEAVDEAIGSFVRSVYTRSSVSTHTETSKPEVLRIRDFVRVVLCELLALHR